MMHARVLLVLVVLVVCGVCCAQQQQSMVNADDLAKEEAFLLGSFPQLIPGLKAKDVYAGGYMSAIIGESGTMQYWGLVANEGIESPREALFYKEEGTDDDNGDMRIQIEPKLTQLSLGGYHLLAVDDKGKLYSMGRGEEGLLGHGDSEHLSVLKPVAALQKRVVKQVAAGFNHNLVLADTGLFTWGNGARGQLGNGGHKDVYIPKLIKTPGLSAKHITQICTGGYHSAILTDKGEVFTFGGNSFGGLGRGNSEDVHSPTVVQDLQGIQIVQIACGGDHTLALSHDGELYSWGWGEKGQLGTGRTTDEFSPQKTALKELLDEDDRVVSIAAGGYATSFAVTEKGKVYGFGWGEFGILGNGMSEDLLSPTLIPGLSSVTKIACGYKHSIALTRNGDVYVFGDDVYGTLGLGAVDLSQSTHTISSILPDSFGAINTAPTSVDTGAARRNATINSWKAKGLNDTSGTLIFSPTSGFVSQGNGRSEIVLANAWAVGVSQQAKAQDNMEDYAIVIDRYAKSLNDINTRVHFGVYDGHNGKVAAEFVASTFHKTLLQELQNTNQTTETAFINAYEYSNLVLNELDVPLTGTTGLTCLSVRNGTHHTLYTANAGDSRAVLSRAGKAIRLSYDHKATDETEADRVKEQGGEISNKRVQGLLAITRALGDTALGPHGVIATPHVDQHEVRPLEDDLLILASDGLWDVLSDQEAVDLALTEKDAQKASKLLMKTALDKGSRDDITVIVARVVRPLFLG